MNNVTDLQFKLDEQKDYPEIIKNINEKGYFGANDYRLLTGACKQGTNKFIEDCRETYGLRFLYSGGDRNQGSFLSF